MTSSYHWVVDHVLSFYGYDCRYHIGRKELVILAIGEGFHDFSEIGSVPIELVCRNHQSAIEMVDTAIGMHRAFGS
jgi:hypothetical protein